MLMKKNSFEQIGRNCYNPAKMIMKQNIEIWPGIFSVMKAMHGGFLLQLELSYKCIREDTLLQYLEAERSHKDLQQISESLKFKSVATRYGTNGSHTYELDHIDFERGPNSTFTMKDGTEISFMDYY